MAEFDNGSAALEQLLSEYMRHRATEPVQALEQLRAASTRLAIPTCLSGARTLGLRGDHHGALALIDACVVRHPDSPELRLQLAQALRAAEQPALAEKALRELLNGPQGKQAANLLSEVLREQGRLSAAAHTMADLVRRDPSDIDTTLTRLRFISQCQRETLAAELCNQALGRFGPELRLLNVAARLAVVLGRFDEARALYLKLLQGGVDLNECFALQALSAAQKYRDRDHPDFELFRSHLQMTTLSPLARASILFGLGKACDDVGDFQGAAAALEQANGLVRGTLSWSSQQWQQEVEERIHEWPIAAVEPTAAAAAITPVFVVGLPRSGTTLIAERLSRHLEVRNRGELSLIPYAEKWVKRSGNPHDPALLRKVAAFVNAHLQQDDAPARWYIDKNPLNFRSINLIHALLPQARFIWCRRDARDNAVSIWAQFFARGEDNGYAYSMADIAAFDRGCEKLMRHWQRMLGVAVHELHYEDMIERPDETLRGVAQFLGLPAAEVLSALPQPDAAITTSSAWQARQPLYTSSRGRWQAYAPYLPELLSLFEPPAG